MRSVYDMGLRRHAFLLLGFVLAVPLLNGCSQLGIAKTEDLAAVESQLQGTDTRVNTLEQNTADMQQTLTQMTASIDTLNARFARARQWIETMNIDTISEDVQSASKKAIDAEARSRAIIEHYLEWLKSLQAMYASEITALEAKLMQSDQTKPLDEPENAPADESKETGGDDGG